MERVAIRAKLTDLRAAGKPVRNYQSVGGTFADSRQQYAFANRLRECKAIGPVAERARHPAAS
jgi:hypothetical protein